MALDLSSLNKAVSFLENALNVAKSKELTEMNSGLQDVIRAGVIQNFEFTYELCWKFMRRWLKENLTPEAIDGISRRKLFRIAAENRLIGDVEQWMRYHEARNLSAHTYQPETAENVYQTAFDFSRDAARLLKALEERND